MLTVRVIGMPVDSEQLSTFYERTSPPLVGLLTAMCGDRAEAEEVAQDAYVKLVQRWSQISGYDSPESWLRMVAVRLLISRKRRTRTWLTASLRLSSDTPGHAPEPSVNSVAVTDALKQLSLEQRSVLVLHHGLDLSVEEVAQMLAIPVGTVKSRLARARAALMPLLADEEVLGHD